MLTTQRETRGTEFIGQIFEKSGDEIRVRDSCSRKRVEYRCSGYGCAWIKHQMMGVHGPTYNLLFSSILFPFYFFFTDSGTSYEESVEMVDTFLEKTHWNVSGEID